MGLIIWNNVFLILNVSFLTPFSYNVIWNRIVNINYKVKINPNSLPLFPFFWTAKSFNSVGFIYLFLHTKQKRSSIAILKNLLCVMCRLKAADSRPPFQHPLTSILRKASLWGWSLDLQACGCCFVSRMILMSKKAWIPLIQTLTQCYKDQEKWCHDPSKHPHRRQTEIGASCCEALRRARCHFCDSPAKKGISHNLRKHSKLKLRNIFKTAQPLGKCQCYSWKTKKDEERLPG